MKRMQEPVIDWSQDNRQQCEENDATEQTVKRGEDLPFDRLHGIDRTHPGKNHGRIQKGIDPLQFAEDVIPHGPQTE